MTFRFQLKNLPLWLTRLVIRTGCRYIFVCPLFYSVLLQNVHLDTIFEMHIHVQVTSVCLIQSLLRHFIGNLYYLFPNQKTCLHLIYLSTIRSCLSLIIKQLVVLAVVSARCKIYKHTSWLLSSSVFRVESTSSKATTIPQCLRWLIH